jgi:hypothetical protein
MDTALPDSIASRSEFAAALLEVLDDAQASGTRELWLVDPDFDEWPLGQSRVCDVLTRWAQGRAERRITLIAQHYDDMPRRHPRFVEWRRKWSHVMQCRAVAGLDASEVPTLLLAGDGLGLHLLDRVHCRGYGFRDESQWRTWREVIDALLQRSEEAFPATTLGL